jgi:hypothetical protein
MDRPYDAPGPSRLSDTIGYDPAESPMAAGGGGTDVYGGSASGVQDKSDNEAADYFVGVGAEETEVEDEKRRRKRRRSSEEAV